MKRLALRDVRSRGVMLTVLVVVLLAGLPVAVWLDLRNLSESALRRQADQPQFGHQQHARLLRQQHRRRACCATHGRPRWCTITKQVPGAIPIPATLSLELGRVISEQQSNIAYRFVSDYPFTNRARHPLDGFEQKALAALRAEPQPAADRRLRLAVRPTGAPDRAGHRWAPTCVACHNTHPDSPKRDWKVGDVRGIQEITISQPIAAQHLLASSTCWPISSSRPAPGVTFIVLQRRQAAAIARHEPRARANQRLPRRGLDEDLAATCRRRSTRASSAARRTSSIHDRAQEARRSSSPTSRTSPPPPSGCSPRR